MASNDYHFETHWTVEGTCEQVYDILIEGTQYPRWWPDVYLAVEETDAGGPHGIHKAGHLLTKGKLPYRLRWSMKVVEVNYPTGFTLTASGDFDGRGIWRFCQDHNLVHVHFEWQLRAEKPLLKYLSFAFKPFFKANHHWAMSRGEESLRRELATRRSLASS